MKPHRLKLAHHLVLGYGLYRKMEVYVSTVQLWCSLVGFQRQPHRRRPAAPRPGHDAACCPPPPPSPLTATLSHVIHPPTNPQTPQRPHMATSQELQKFHSEDYVQFLQRVSPDAGRTVANNLQKFNVGEYTDCPIFDGMMEFCKLYTGCSIGEWVGWVVLTAWHEGGRAAGCASIHANTHYTNQPTTPPRPHKTRKQQTARRS